METSLSLVPNLTLDILLRGDQDLLVQVVGSDVLSFAPNVQGKPEEGEIVLPDPVLAFAAAARHGVFAPSYANPLECKVDLLKKEVRSFERQQSWQMRLHALDPGAILILTNMLLARVLDHVDIRSIGSEGAERTAERVTELHALTYPRVTAGTPFPVGYQPTRLSRERSMEITFAREAAAFVEQVSTALRDWSVLLLLGGYPAEGMAAYQSAAVADPPFLLDPHTVQIEFPDIFLCDEDCLFGLINLTRVFHQTLSPVDNLRIH